MKTSLFFVIAITLISPVQAGKQKKGGMSPEQQKEQQEKKEEKAKREKTRLAVKEILDVKDKNNDGSLSLDEYLIGESDAEGAKTKFTKININGDRYISKGELEKSLDM
jgi:hypothetical protein